MALCGTWAYVDGMDWDTVVIPHLELHPGMVDQSPALGMDDGHMTGVSGHGNAGLLPGVVQSHGEVIGDVQDNPVAQPEADVAGLHHEGHQGGRGRRVEEH